MTDDDLDKELERAGIPMRMRPSIRKYVLAREHMGSFLRAVFANDLCMACGLADDENRSHMYNYAQLLYWLPTSCWGSYETVEEWIND